jgi:hypothetical protein
VEVFKNAEKKAMTEMRQIRVKAHQREQEKRTRQTELFEPEVLHSTDYFDLLRERYLTKAKEQIRQSLQGKGRVAYDDAWSLALKEPLVWESDLKEWIADWKKAGMIKVEGLRPKQRVPQLGIKRSLVWLSSQ